MGIFYSLCFKILQANAAYFKGNWEQQFKKSNTKLALFYVSQKEVTPTMMMYQKGSFRHGIFIYLHMHNLFHG